MRAVSRGAGQRGKLLSAADGGVKRRLNPNESYGVCNHGYINLSSGRQTPPPRGLLLSGGSLELTFDISIVKAVWPVFV